MNVMIFSSDGEIKKGEFPNKDLAEEFIMKHLPRSISFGNKSFAVVENEEAVNYVIIEKNTPLWITAEEFFSRLNIECIDCTFAKLFTGVKFDNQSTSLLGKFGPKNL